jgi:hypothetical protein
MKTDKDTSKTGDQTTSDGDGKKTGEPATDDKGTQNPADKKTEGDQTGDKTADQDKGDEKDKGADADKDKGADPNKPADEKEKKPAKVEFTEEQKAAIEEIVKGRLSKDRKSREREEKEKAGEFEPLYNETKAELDTAQSELTTEREKVTALTSERDTLRTSLAAYAKSELASLNENLRDLNPFDVEKEPEKALDWITKAKAKNPAKADPTQPRKPGTKENPKPADNSGEGEKDENARNSQGKMYRNF